MAKSKWAKPIDTAPTELIELPPELPAMKAPAEPATSGEVLAGDRDGRCLQCSQLERACGGKHILLSLKQDCQLNSVLYRAGLRVVPEDAFHAFRSALE